MKNSITRFVLIPLFCSLISFLANAQDLPSFPDSDQIYRIQEFTRGELVSIGSDGNVLRWPPTGKMEQQFKFVSSGQDQWRIQSVKFPAQYLNVENFGNIRIDNLSDWKGQIFKIEQVSNPIVRIKEGTADEYVAVGSNGNVLRWSMSNKKDQIFGLLPLPVHNQPSIAESYLYEIKEFTAEERVAVGSDNNVLRWQQTGGNEQKYLIIPEGEATWRIVSMKNGEYVAVGSNGNILSYPYNDEVSQTFIIRDANEVRSTVNFVEQTNQEYMSVGSNGNIVRWAEAEGLSQEFQLIYQKWGDKPQLDKTEQPIEPPKTLSPGQELPEQTKKTLFAVDAVPAALIYDPKYGDKARHKQVEKNPYYIVKRFQYWDASGTRGNIGTRDGKEEEVVTETIRHGWDTSQHDSASETFSISGTAGVKAGGDVKAAKAEGSLSMTVGYSTNKLRAYSKSENHSESREVTVTIPKSDTPMIYAVWSKVDAFEVYDYEGEYVDSWEIVNDNDEFKWTYKKQ